MKKVGILYNPIKENALEKAEELAQVLQAKNVSTWTGKTGKTVEDWEAIDKSVDLVIIFGGDGTYLGTARQLCSQNISVPILGINRGHLGFLSESEEIGFEELAERIANDDLAIETRSLLQAFLPEQNKTVNALNDIVVTRSHHSNLLYTDLYVDENLLASFRADGLIIATPTGSTAYALSAGGSVMDPNISAFQIIPISPHSLTSRPHVISDDQTIILESKDEIDFFMQADGQELITLPPKTKVIIQKSPYKLKLAKLMSGRQNFYSILRDKLRWGSFVG